MLLHDYYPEEVRVVAEARAAAAAGFEVDVIALRGPGEPPEELVDGVRVIRLPVAHQHGGGRLTLLGEYLRFTVLALVEAAKRSRPRRYDVVHVNNPPDFLIVAALLPRLVGSKVVLDVHDLTPDMFMMRFDNAPGGLLDRALRLVERSAARLADAVVTVHEPYRRELGAHGVPLEKIAVVMNSLDEGILPTGDESDGAGSGFRVVYHGTVTPHYGVGVLVEALGLAQATIPGLRLEIYGAGDDLPAVTEQVRANGLEATATIVPRFLPQADVLRAVRGASVGVIPNLPTRLNRFALPTKLFEYVALGIPAVAADLPTIRGHFSETEVLFFEPGSASSLARALESVARDPEAAERRAAAARERYDAYRWHHSARTYTDLIWRLAERRRRGVATQRPPAGA
jgi:glycosyltransferase involved in cell wall biosynthesis